MALEEIIPIIMLLAIPALFIWVIISAILSDPNAESLRGQRKTVEIDGQTFEFRFWVDPSVGANWCGVFILKPPIKKLWKKINNDYCVAKTFGETDPVRWCYTEESLSCRKDYASRG